MSVPKMEEFNDEFIVPHLKPEDYPEKIPRNVCVVATLVQLLYTGRFTILTSQNEIVVKKELQDVDLLPLLTTRSLLQGLPTYN